MTANEYANLALTVLKKVRDEQGIRYGLSTKVLASRMGVADTSRDTLMKVLEKLVLLGKIVKQGAGKFLWRIDCDSWDSYRPFAPKPQEENSYPPVAPASPSYGAPQSATEQELTEQLTETRQRIQEMEDVITVLTRKGAEKTTEIERLHEKVKEAGQTIKTIKIERYDGTKETLKNVALPSYFDRVLSLCKRRKNVLLVGPAGCGKSTLAAHVAKVLGLNFGKVGGSGGLQEHHLLGVARPNFTTGKDRFRTTSFLRCYEEGGLCLIDELDGADSNCMLALNPALDKSDLLPIPNREEPAVKHKDFVCIATANTFGRGATRVYAGRNQLDEATLDRFRIGIIECDYDPTIEKALCPDDKLRDLLQGIRARIEKAGLRRILSSRFLEEAHDMVENAGWTHKDVLDQFFSGWGKDERLKVEINSVGFNFATGASEESI